MAEPGRCTADQRTNGVNLSERCRQPVREDRGSLNGFSSGRCRSAVESPNNRVISESILPELTVTSLGRFSIMRDGVRLPACRSRRAEWVFRYLLTRPDQSAYRDELAEAIWPNSNGGESQHSLHVAVSALRRHLDPPEATQSLICFDRQRYFLNPSMMLHDDCSTFHHLYVAGNRFHETARPLQAEDAYRQALDLYRGNYDLDDLAFDWAVTARETHLAHMLTMLDRLGKIYLARGPNSPSTVSRASSASIRIVRMRSNA